MFAALCHSIEGGLSSSLHALFIHLTKHNIYRSLLQLLLITIVALSTCDVLPILSIKQLEPIFDRTESKPKVYSINDKLRNSDIANDIFYKVAITPSGKLYTPLLLPEKSNVIYVRDRRNEGVDNENINKDGKYDDEGYRKEQWHNYPRQLDRLQKYLHRQHEVNTNLNPDPDDPDEVIKNIYELAANDNNLSSDKNRQDILDEVVAATSPLLILKIRLAYLKNDQNTDYDMIDALPIEIIANNNMEENDREVMDPINVSNVKREETGSKKESHDLDKTPDSKKTVKKRIFSLWSRLQSLSHKGHELHHRRHLHAFYGFPDDDSGGGTGALTAETRASFIRPPGSPLRWG